MSSAPDNMNQRWLVQAILSRAGQHVGVWAHGLDTIDAGGLVNATIGELASFLELSGKQIGLQVARTSLRDPVEIGELLRGGMAAILLQKDRSLLLTFVTRSTFSAVLFQNQLIQSITLSRRELTGFLAQSDVALLAVKPLQDCDSISANPVFPDSHEPELGTHHEDHHDHDDLHHDHISPLRRFGGLLRMERSDVTLVAIFAFVASILSLATPLAVETLVNVISWGVYIQPLVVLALVLLTSLVLAGVFGVLQNVVVEIVQRRQFVRIVSDLAHRFPISNRLQMKAEHPRELANRVLDIMTIQKATAVLLLDGTNIIIVSLVGLLLLGFYHAYLLSFVIIMLVSMTFITWALGRGGVPTAIDESKTKYRLVHWLQDVLDSPTAFRINGGDLLAINRASNIAGEYVEARIKHFRVLLRQIIFAAALQALALSSVLGIGGWLVMQGDLTLGQLVAAELVVALVVGAFSKAGKSIEKFYDLMASLDKVGHLLDLKTDSNVMVDPTEGGPLPLEWSEVEFDCGLEKLSVPAGSIEPAKVTAIIMSEPLPQVSHALAGLIPPSSGSIQVEQTDVKALSVAAHQGRLLTIAAGPEIFFGSVASNIDMGRSFISLAIVKETLKKVNLWRNISSLPSGLNATLQSTGYPLSPVQMNKLMIARALVGSPRLLIVDSLLDPMTPADRQHLLDLFQSLKSNCTILLITQHSEIAEKCDHSIDWRQA